MDLRSVDTLSHHNSQEEPSASKALPPAPSGLRLIMTLGVIALFSGLLVVTVVELTAPRIAENQRLALQAAVLEVIPGAVQRRDFVLHEGALYTADAAPSGAGILLYAGYDAEDALQGVALQASGRGYADVIRILYSYDPRCACIRGMKVLASKETPGLGDKIETDARFQANFEALSATLDTTRNVLTHPIVTVRQGNKQNPWEIDGISGATISANAIGRMLNESTQRLLPQLDPHWSQLQAAAQ